MRKSGVLHYIVSRSRRGWAVNADADLVSEHDTPDAALTEARRLTLIARAEGRAAELVDLSDQECPPPSAG